jgi:adenylate cyclase
MAEARVERRLAAILAADIAGYSRLMGDDEEGTLAALKACRRELMDPKIAEYRGRIVKTTGDGALVEFASAVDAARCAIEIQRAMASRNAAIPEDRRVEFRIGINVGDIILDEGDIYGDGVNIAARVESLASPGAICLSEDAYKQIKGKVELDVSDMGEQQLKNIAQPVRVFGVRLDGASARPTLALPDKPSIAVLAFQNMSGDPEQEYFVDGMVEDIITALSRMRWLFVIARNSSFVYKGRAVDLKQVGRELGVRYVLEGSVRRGGERVRVSAQLIDAEAGTHVWAERYDRNFTDVFAVQDEITTAVALAIGPAVVDAEQQRARRKTPDNLGAWDSYMRGLWHLARLDTAENDQARRLFERAVELDPNLSQAYQGLAYSYLDEIRVFGTRSWAETRIIAEPLARRAVALDPNDASAHAVLGWVLETVGDHEAALDRAKRALELNANCADAYRLKGLSLVFSGRHHDGCQTLLTHLRLNPRDPANWRAFRAIAMARYLLGDYAGAVEADRRAMQENLNQRISHRWLVAALGQLGRITEAQNVVSDLLSTVPPGWFEQRWGRRPPWMREEDHARLLEGLRKVGWHR